MHQYNAPYVPSKQLGISFISNIFFCACDTLNAEFHRIEASENLRRILSDSEIESDINIYTYYIIAMGQMKKLRKTEGETQCRLLTSDMQHVQTFTGFAEVIISLNCMYMVPSTNTIHINTLIYILNMISL